MGGGGGRGRLTVVGWIVVLGAIVVVGLGGRLGSTPSPPSGPLGTDAPALADIPPPALPVLLVLSDPAPPPASVTGIPLWVRGDAQPQVRQVVVVLRDGDGEVARQTVLPSDRGSFSVVFTLRPPRPRMELTVLAIGRDSQAESMAVARRTVLVDALRSTAAAAPAPPVSRRGEDGIFGGVGVDPASVPAPSLTPRPPGWGWPVGKLAWQANPVQK